MFVLPVLAAAVAPLGVGVALTVGAFAYAASAMTGWLAARATPAGLAALKRSADERAAVSGC
jgi:hypothetical protein